MAREHMVLSNYLGALTMTPALRPREDERKPPLSVILKSRRPPQLRMTMSVQITDDPIAQAAPVSKTTRKKKKAKKGTAARRTHTAD